MIALIVIVLLMVPIEVNVSMTWQTCRVEVKVAALTVWRQQFVLKQLSFHNGKWLARWNETTVDSEQIVDEARQQLVRYEDVWETLKQFLRKMTVCQMAITVPEPQQWTAGKAVVFGCLYSLFSFVPRLCTPLCCVEQMPRLYVANEWRFSCIMRWQVGHIISSVITFIIQQGRRWYERDATSDSRAHENRA